MGIWIPGGLKGEGGGGVEIVEWSTGTDAEIAAMLEAHYNNEIDILDYWSVGDERIIHLDAMVSPSDSSVTKPAQDITVVIIGFNHTDLETPINGHTKAAITVQTKETLFSNTSSSGTNGHCYMGQGTSSTYGTTVWSNSVVRTYINNTVYNAFDSDFKSMIKSSKHYRHDDRTGSTAFQYIDTLFLPSYPEIFGTASYSYYTATNPTEGIQFEYYETSANRKKYSNNNSGQSNGTAQSWWIGSVSNYSYSSTSTSARGMVYVYLVSSSNNGTCGYSSCGSYSTTINKPYRTTYTAGSRNALAPAWAM